MKIIRRILSILGIIILVAAIGFFFFAPKYIDQSMNKTLHKSITDSVPKWYDSIPFIADMHCDALLWDRNILKKADHGHVDIPRMLEANEAFQIFSIVSKTPRGINYEKNTAETDQVALLSFAQLRNWHDWFSMKSRALHQCEALHKTAEYSEGTFRVIQTKSDLEQFINDRAKNRSIAAGMLALEGAHCLENDLTNLDTFFNAGVRYIGLTHFFDNEWGGSAHGVDKGGLTEKGKQLIDAMIKKHIIIDLAHASPKLIDDIFKYTSVPLLVSHTGVKATCDNVRNLSDAQIDEIGKRKGLICIGMWETAVCGTDAMATAKAIKYVMDRIGVERVSMGSDFDGAIEASYDINGFREVVAALQKLGISRIDIEKVMGGNIRDFLLQNLPE